MDAILVVPPEYRYVKGFSSYEYLGIEYIASFIRHFDYDVKILNCNYNTTIDQVVDTAIKEKPDIIGISIPTMPNLSGAIQIIKDLRTAGYGGYICLGGHVATFACEKILETIPEVDIIIRGEGEFTFLELLDKIKSNTSFDTTPGIAFRDGFGNLTINPPRDLIKNLDDLPFPSRDLLEEVINNEPKMAQASVSTGRGCYGNCSFCSVNAFYSLCRGPRVRLRSAYNVVDEIEDVIEKHGIHSFFFVDDNFIGPGKVGRKRAETIADEIIRRDLSINFTISCRPNDIDAHLISQLKKAGMNRIFVGIESGVQSILDRFNKKTTVDQNINTINLLKRSGITWNAGFIIYDPDITYEEFRENILFIRKTGLFRYPAAVLLLNGLTVYPGTPIEKTLAKDNRLHIINEDIKFIGNVRDNQIQKEYLGGDLWKLLDSEYEFIDSRMTIIKYGIDSTKAVLSPQYDIIWPLFGECCSFLNLGFHNYDSSNKRTDELLNILKQDRDQMERWINNFGLLIVTILEAIVDTVEEDKDIQINDFIKQIYLMVDEYNTRHFDTTFEDKVKDTQNLLKEMDSLVNFNNSVS